ncbi:hypothetical protein JTE90_005506 [Oedothorax gibbosus]|uniref:Uncharacterized protein n=1 Tax=Oedothorax gibbosus TaxID=931172 RepID=A0AAV6UU28_9ARAC|nr:hypothetical protein JTE90_005506 [Oedothorax gibbosus]
MGNRGAKEHVQERTGDSPKCGKKRTAGFTRRLPAARGARTWVEHPPQRIIGVRMPYLGVKWQLERILPSQGVRTDPEEC